MSIRLIAIDLDGTLLNSRSEISPANREALAAAIDRGIRVAVVTGRRSHSARPYVRQLPCPVTLISSNGALITSESGEVVYRNFLPRAIALGALAATRPFRGYAAALFDIPGRGQILMQDCAAPDGPLTWYRRQSADCLQLVDQLENHLTTDPIQVLFGGPPGTVTAIEPEIRQSPVGEAVQLTWTKYLTRNISLLDVMNRGCTKGSALARWAELCKISASEVMAIGDNHNDLEMLQFAGTAVLMGNSSPGLESSGWRTTLSNDQDGVACAINAYA